MTDASLPFKVLHITSDRHYLGRLSYYFSCFEKYFDVYGIEDPRVLLDGTPQAFDLVITEIEFPGYDEDEIVEYLLQLKAFLPAAKILIWTACKNPGFIDRCLHTNVIDGRIEKWLQPTNIVQASFKALLGGMPNPL